MNDPYYQFYLADNDEICLINGDVKITRHQLLRQITFFAALYRVSKGGRVAVLAENRPEWPAALLSAWMNYAVGVPIDSMASVSDISYILQDCTPEAVFCTAQTYDSAKKAVEESKITAALINVDDIKYDWEQDSSVSEMPHHEPDDLALLVYTSGTTSAAKGCMISFHNLEINFKSMTEDVPVWLPDQVTLALLPFHHILPLQGCLLMPLHRKGCRIVFTKSMSGPDILQAVHDNHVTVLIAVPRVFQMFRDSILKKIRENPIASAIFSFSKAVGNIRFSRLLFHSVQEKFGGKIRYFPTGGAALDYEVYYDLCALGFEVLPGSGMSEAAPVVAFTRPGHPKKDSAGQLISIVEGKIAPDGEILLRGEGIISGYWRKPKETYDAFQSDGWFHTGDLGRIDEENYIFYTGRKKELIILSNGKNVAPLVIEEKIMSMSDYIEEVAVVQDGDILNALILPNFKRLKELQILNIEETIRQNVIAKYNQQSEAYMRILRCTFISAALPRTRLGKLQRHKLRSFLSEKRKNDIDENVQIPDIPEYKLIVKYLKDERQCAVVNPDDHFEIDLGVDSLAKIEMLVFLKQTFDMDIKEQVISENYTPRMLSEYLHKNGGAFSGEYSKVIWSDILQKSVRLTLPKTSFLHHPLNLLSRTLQKIFLNIRRTGSANVPDGPCIFACNHQSFLDGLLLMGAMDKTVLQNTFFYAKSGHIQNGLIRYLADRHNIIVVDINSDVKGSLQKLAEVLRLGKKIAIFPEGTRTYDGSLGIFKYTFAILAKELHVPIVPVVIDGAYQVLPRGSFFPHLFRTVNISILPGFIPEMSESYQEISQKTSAAINAALCKKNG